MDDVGVQEAAIEIASTTAASIGIIATRSVTVDLVPVYADVACHNVEPSAVVVGRIAVDLVLPDYVSPTPLEIDATTVVSREAGDKATADVEPLHHHCRRAVNVHHTPLSLSIQGSDVSVRVGGTPVSDGVAASKGETLANVDRLGKRVNPHRTGEHTLADTGDLDHVTTGGRVHRRLNAGVDLTAADAGKASTGIELVRAYVRLLPKRTRPPTVVYLYCLRKRHRVYTRRTSTKAEIRLGRIHKRWGA